MLSPLAKRNRFYCHASSADKVKSLSPHHRFVIALRSPSEVAETGLRVGPSERKARKLACGIESDTFSGPVCEQKLRNCGDFLRFSGQGSRISLQSRLCGGEGGIRIRAETYIQQDTEQQTAPRTTLVHGKQCNWQVDWQVNGRTARPLL